MWWSVSFLIILPAPGTHSSSWSLYFGILTGIQMFSIKILAEFILFYFDFCHFTMICCTNKQTCKKYSTLIYAYTNKLKHWKSLNSQYPTAICKQKANTINVIFNINVLNVNRLMSTGWTKNINYHTVNLCIFMITEKEIPHH